MANPNYELSQGQNITREVTDLNDIEYVQNQVQDDPETPALDFVDRELLIPIPTPLEEEIDHDSLRILEILGNFEED